MSQAVCPSGSDPTVVLALGVGQMQTSAVLLERRLRSNSDVELKLFALTLSQNNSRSTISYLVAKTSRWTSVVDFNSEGKILALSRYCQCIRQRHEGHRDELQSEFITLLLPARFHIRRPERHKRFEYHQKL